MIDTFMTVFRQKLAALHAQDPKAYWWPIEKLDDVCGRMRNAFLNCTYNNDGAAIKATCKELGIKSTYKAINAYIKGAST